MTQSTSSRQQTLQQKRAAHAWERIEEIDQRLNKGKPDEKFKKKYGSLVRHLPALILSDGLGQTLAFLKAVDGRSKEKGDTPEIHAYRHIELWSREDDSQLIKPEDRQMDLLNWLITKNSSISYRRASTEIVAYLSWLKRFAEAKGWKDED